MKLFIASVVLLVSGSVFAGDMCNVNVQGGLRITSEALEFSKDDAEQYKILGEQTLVVKGKEIKLNRDQQLLVTEYASSVRAIVPEVRQLTLDGIDLGAEAMKLVFDEFLGPNNSAAKDVHRAFSLLRTDVEKNFSSENPIYFNQKGGIADNFLGNEFESRVNAIMENSGKEVAWSVMKAFAVSFFSPGSTSANMEARMNKFGEKMEAEMTQRSKKLEARGDLVCGSVMALDRKEDAMRQAIPSIAEFNFLLLKKNQSASK